MISIYMKFIATDKFMRDVGNNYILPSISVKGEYVYLVYSDQLESQNNKAVELFKNYNGKLVSINQLLPDNLFPIIRSGYASKN